MMTLKTSHFGRPYGTSPNAACGRQVESMPENSQDRGKLRKNEAVSAALRPPFHGEDGPFWGERKGRGIGVCSIPCLLFSE